MERDHTLVGNFMIYQNITEKNSLKMLSLLSGKWHLVDHHVS
jgi:hypothetical protein